MAKDRATKRAQKNCAHIFDDNGLCFECDKRQGASDYAKRNGMPSLEAVSRLTGQSRQTLNNWYHDKPELFIVVIAGAVQLNK